DDGEVDVVNRTRESVVDVAPCDPDHNTLRIFRLDSAEMSQGNIEGVGPPGAAAGMVKDRHGHLAIHTVGGADRGGNAVPVSGNWILRKLLVALKRVGEP